MEKKKSRAIRCVAFLCDKEFVGCDYAPPPRLDAATSALREVFDGHCPFVFSFVAGPYAYYVVCSCEPDKEELEGIRAATEALSFRMSHRSEVYVLGNNPES